MRGIFIGALVISQIVAALSSSEIWYCGDLPGLLCTLVQTYFFTGFPASIESGISETLSLGEKSLSLAKNPFIFMGEIWNFP